MGASTVERGFLEGDQSFTPTPALRWSPHDLLVVGLFPQKFIEYLLCARAWFKPWGSIWGRNPNLA